MRIVFVNHCHPDTPHICGTRMREFARALAARGHRIALLTLPLRGQETVPSPADIAEMLTAGVEPSPMIIATPPKRWPMLNLLRAGLWPWGIRQGMIAYNYLRHGGLHADWRAGAKPYAAVLADHFKPDLVWASFGNTDCWSIAQDIARRAKCPWVADIKDTWTRFIPGPLRNRLAKRFSDAAAWSALSRLNAENARPWFSENFHVVYSGFESDTIRRAPTTDENGTLLMTLTGSVYGGSSLPALFAALGSWAVQKPDDIRKRLLLVYRGNDQYEVGAALARAKLPFEAKAGGFIPLDELQTLHRHAFANLYVTTPRGFHHKTIELLAARRPIVAFPPDHVEAADLAARAGSNFSGCATADDVAIALDAALVDYAKTENAIPVGLEGLSWDAQAADLEKLFESIARS